MTGLVVWITGVSGSGKTSTARAFVELMKSEIHREVLHLDGDEIRAAVKESGLVGEFSYERRERRRWADLYSGLASLFGQQGHCVVVSTISMFNETYETNRRILPRYFEVFLDVPMSTVRERDSRGYYAAGVRDLSGVDMPIDRPVAANMVITDPSKTPEDVAVLLLDQLQKGNYL